MSKNEEWMAAYEEAIADGQNQSEAAWYADVITDEGWVDTD